MAVMEKEILERGIVTHALTDQTGHIYGFIKSEKIYFMYWLERGYKFYWSEVYSEKHMCQMIRRGMHLSRPTEEELQRYLEQSKVNLH